MKRQKWVDVWDGSQYRPLEEIAAAPTVAPETATAPTTAPIDDHVSSPKRTKEDVVQSKDMNVGQSTVAPETATAPVTAPIDDPLSSPKSTEKDGLPSKETDVGQSIATKDEPRTPPPTQGSATDEFNKSSEHAKTSLLATTGDVKNKETGDTCSHVSSDSQRLEALNTELHSDKDKPKESKISTGRVDLNSPGAKAMIRGLQNSRWAKGDAKEPQGAYKSPTKQDSMGLHIPSPKATVSGPAQQATDVASKSDLAEMRNQGEEPVAVKKANESDDHSRERNVAKLKQEKEEQRSENEALDLPQTEFVPQVQYRDTWQSWKSESESHPSLGQALDEHNQPPSEQLPSKAEATHVPLTSGALCATFGSCPKDRSEIFDPMTRVSATGIDDAEEKPAQSEEKPAHAEEKPAQSEEKPAHSEKPAHAEEKPAHSEEQPAHSEEQPAHWTFNDPRGQEPVEQYQEQDWNETRRPKPKNHWETNSISSVEEFFVPGPFHKFLVWWTAGIPDIKSHILERNIPNHHLCDIDTCTGNLIEPVHYPETIRPLGVDWAKLNRTAQDVANQARLQLKSKADKAAQKKARVEEAAREAAIFQEMDEAAKARQVQVECHLRAATIHDMAEVTAIYNREVTGSHSVFDTEPVQVDKFRILLEICKVLQQPFIVAVEGWHFPDVDTSNRRILGFCFVDISDKGIMGSRHTIANARGNITLIVDRAWRQKKIGTALLDVVVNCCSTNHIHRQGYQWVYDPRDTTHVSALYNGRIWDKVQMEVLVKSKKTKDEVVKAEQWLLDFLEDRFPLILTKHDHQFAWRPHMEGNGSTPGWIDRLTFEHYCRPTSPGP